MNKEFRVWNPRTKECLDDCWMYQSGKLDHDTVHSFDLQDCVVQKNTGLTDSTGRKIFEGDIVKWDDASNGKYWRVAQVIWHERGSWCFRIIPNKSINCFPHGQTNDFMMGNFIYSPNPNKYGNVLQVIGNIFETPELLK